MDTNNAAKTIKMSDLLDEALRFLNFLKDATKMFLVMAFCGVALAGMYWLIQKPKFEGSASFVLEEKGSSMGGGLSGLASQFGVDIGSLTGGNGLFAGDNIIDILKSRNIIEKVLVSKVDSSKAINGPTLADLYISFANLKSRGVSFADLKVGQPHSRLQDSILLVIVQKLNKKNLSVERINKKGSIIEVKTISANEDFSKLFTERLVGETMRFYIDIKTSVAQRNIQRLEHRADSLMALLNEKSYKSASMQVLDANIAFKSTAVPVEVSQREKSVTYALYSEVVKNLEASRMALSGQTPVINLLDNAKYPLEDQSKPLWLLLLIGAAAGFALAFIIAFYNFR